MLIRKCCKCGKFLGLKLGGGKWGITHTYCGKCMEEESRKLQHDKRRHNKQALWKQRMYEQIQHDANYFLGIDDGGIK